MRFIHRSKNTCKVPACTESHSSCVRAGPPRPATTLETPAPCLQLRVRETANLDGLGGAPLGPWSWISAAGINLAAAASKGMFVFTLDFLKQSR